MLTGWWRLVHYGCLIVQVSAGKSLLELPKTVCISISYRRFVLLKIKAMTCSFSNRNSDAAVRNKHRISKLKKKIGTKFLLVRLFSDFS
jgi:hypothetical protein